MSLFDKALGYEMGQADQKRAMKYIRKLEADNRQLVAKYNKLVDAYNKLETEKINLENSSQVEINRLKNKCNKLASYYHKTKGKL